MQGKEQAASQQFLESLSPALEKKNQLIVALCLCGLAGLALAQGQALRAARLLGAAEGINPADPRNIFSTTVMYTQDLAATRALLGAAAFSAAWARGREMSLEEAIAYALGEDSSALGAILNRTILPEQ